MEKVTKQGFSFDGKGAANYYKGLNKVFGQGTMDGVDAVTLASTANDMGFPVLQGTMDAQPQALITSANITGLSQFLQTFLPGVVRTMQAPLKLEQTIGATQAGQWSDVSIVQRVQEWTGFMREYGDYQSKPNVSYNVNYEYQNVVRFEIGYDVMRLQEERASRSMVSDSGEKQSAAAQVTQQLLNNVGYNGYNSGNNKTYGFLNNPNLPAYVTVPNGASLSPLWSSKTWNERQNDLILMANALMTQTQGRGDVSEVASTLTIPVALWQYFSSTAAVAGASGGYSLFQWFKTTYPAARIVASPNMDLANGGANAMYWFIDRFAGDEAGSDDGSTFRQVIPARFLALNTEQLVGGYKTGYTCAHAGTFALRPLGVARYSGM
jgi:hypothetical protein